MAETLFIETRYTVKQLVGMIELGSLALPDLQRPFVWEKAKVRDLLDSMYRGFPVGYLLLWNAGSVISSHTIGTDGKQSTASSFIVDGQQRLTSLYAVMKGEKILNKKFEEESIKIAFRPRDATFAVADAATERDPEFLPDISTLWTRTEYETTTKFLGRLAAARSDGTEANMSSIAEDEQGDLSTAISRLHNLETFSFSANEISQQAGDDQVAEIFMRINSGGMKLNQADFILTLMSVYREDDRRRLEAFAAAARHPSEDGKASPFNYLIRPEPDQLLRTAVLNAFQRGRLSSVTALLRGASVDSGEEIGADEKEAQFTQLGEAIERTLDLSDWHEFLKTVNVAGYFREKDISSGNNIMFSYGFYLLGRHQFGLSHGELRSPIARFFFMSSLTGRYTGSFEGQVTSDVREFAEAASPEDFLKRLTSLVNTSLTDDFWTISLPEELRSSASRGPALFAYGAALCLLNARLPFTASGAPMPIRDLFSPGITPPKEPMDRHHLFPRKYLERTGVSATTQINQIANMSFVEWRDNIEISDTAPSKYWPTYAPKFTASDLADHALFEGWDECEYNDFLERRRALMADAIRRGFETISAIQPSGDLAEAAPSNETTTRR